jgi:hypothetical protein
MYALASPRSTIEKWQEPASEPAPAGESGYTSESESELSNGSEFTVDVDDPEGTDDEEGLSPLPPMLSSSWERRP